MTAQRALLYLPISRLTRTANFEEWNLLVLGYFSGGVECLGCSEPCNESSEAALQVLENSTWMPTPAMKIAHQVNLHQETFVQCVRPHVLAVSPLLPIPQAALLRITLRMNLAFLLQHWPLRR